MYWGDLFLKLTPEKFPGNALSISFFDSQREGKILGASPSLLFNLTAYVYAFIAAIDDIIIYGNKNNCVSSSQASDMPIFPLGID